jgi:hypothetical protein
MDKKWQAALSDLKAFINTNTSIVIKRESIDIPEQVKIDFYRLFDGVRTEVVVSELREELERAWRLSENYIEVEKTISKQKYPGQKSQKKRFLTQLFSMLHSKFEAKSFKFDEVILED